jgi:large subunit ribosomal protein L33
MAKKKGNRIHVRMKSSESGHFYLTEKNRKNNQSRMELRRYDPVLRKHVLYKEEK